jgi:hypothetical protein
MRLNEPTPTTVADRRCAIELSGELIQITTASFGGLYLATGSLTVTVIVVIVVVCGLLTSRRA